MQHQLKAIPKCAYRYKKWLRSFDIENVIASNLAYCEKNQLEDTEEQFFKISPLIL